MGLKSYSPTEDLGQPKFEEIVTVTSIDGLPLDHTESALHDIQNNLQSGPNA